VEGQSIILEKIIAPKCINKSYPSICIGYFTSAKVNTSYFVLKEKMSHHTGGRGSKKCHQMSPGGGGF
jgi:hypothetical protein